MRFHVVSLPHTQTIQAFSYCAYTEKVRKFCRMMKERGHTVFLYAGDQNEAPCDELITCVTEEERLASPGGKDYLEVHWDGARDPWPRFNLRAIEGIRARHRPKDFICIIGGAAQRIFDNFFQHPQHQVVEFGIGYHSTGTFSRYRVFESYAWMHMHYGLNKSDVDGKWFDCVIPNYFEPEAFPFRAKKKDYYLYIGRLIDRKGFRIAAEVCGAIGAKLILAGAGAQPVLGKHCEYVGVVGPEERGLLMSGAKAVFVPTQYVEPFGGVAVEAMMCGTPVITTDWGAFTETNVHGLTGFRCRSFQEFIDATEHVEGLSPFAIRAHAVARYSLDAIAPHYEAYFKRLHILWGQGWYQRAA